MKYAPRVSNAMSKKVSGEEWIELMKVKVVLIVNLL